MPDDDKLVPSQDISSLNQQPEPGTTGQYMSVPEDIASAGHDTTTPYPDSPESLDQEITEGANREAIDPHHSFDRPAVDSVDEEEHGVR